MKEFLPLGFMKVRNVEKKIFAEHRSLMGTSEIDSKYKYVKLARGLPTFGVHFFLVKVSISIKQISLFVKYGQNFGKIRPKYVLSHSSLAQMKTFV